VDTLVLDQRVRIAAFQWLIAQKATFGEVLSRSVLAQGFSFQGTRVPIVGPKGIFKPSSLKLMPLSITTIPGGPYDDDLRDGDSVIHYRYRGTNPNHSDNIGLRAAHETQTPLIFCYRVMPDRYLVSYPVFVCGDDPLSLTFDIQLDDEIALERYLRQQPGKLQVEVSDDRVLDRRYITTSAKRRLHQVAFRERVLRAYETRCALCRLRHGALLDAAHIIPDGEIGGEPEVSNGLALCKIHHAAFDLNYLGITPKYKVEVRADLLDEVDGPMLQHGIKAMHGESIFLPKARHSQPSETRLEARFERFRKANQPS
jgi:putative restriction endonuclease